MLFEVAMSVSLQIKNEFNTWVDSNCYEWMEHRHQFLLEGIIRSLNLQSDSKVLELGCGQGWAIRHISTLIKDGLAVGVDISEKMIQKATEANPWSKVLFLNQDMNQLPFISRQFTHIYSIETFFYTSDEHLQMLFNNLFHLLLKGGKLAFALSYFEENTHTQNWQNHLSATLYNRSIQTYITMLKHSGFKHVDAELLYDPSHLPAEYNGKWFENREHLDLYRKAGSLLISAEK